MDSFFGIGLPELIFILVLASLVMGPQRIREAARWLGLMTVKMQSISRTFTRQLNAELDSMGGADDLRGAMEDVQELRRQVRELQEEMWGSVRSSVDGGKTAVAQTRQSLQSILPPDRVSAKNDEAPRPSGNGAPPTGQGPNTPPAIPQPLEIADDPE